MKSFFLILTLPWVFIIAPFMFLAPKSHREILSLVATFLIVVQVVGVVGLLMLMVR